MKTYKLILLLMVLFGTFGCADDDDAPEPVNEEELITTVKMVLTAVGEDEEHVFLFTDIDGEGGEAPELTSDTLRAFTTYDVRVHFLNEAEEPIDSISHEVREEGDEHQVFLLFQPQLDISYSYTDADVHGNPIGLEMQMVTDTVGETDMTLILRHEPNKEAPQVAEGDITNAGGETDVEVTFDLYVEES